MTASHNASGAGVGVLATLRNALALRAANAGAMFAQSQCALASAQVAALDAAMALPGKWREVAAAARREADSEASEALRSELYVEASVYRQNACALEAIFGPAPPATDAPEQSHVDALTLIDSELRGLRGVTLVDGELRISLDGLKQSGRNQYSGVRSLSSGHRAGCACCSEMVSRIISLGLIQVCESCWDKARREDATPPAGGGDDPPDFDTLQSWALANGCGGQSYDEAYRAWLSANEMVVVPRRLLMKIAGDVADLGMPKMEAALRRLASGGGASKEALDTAAVEVGHIEFESMRQCADSWLAVNSLLHELTPGWTNTSLTGREAAIAAIRGLAGGARVGQEWQPIETAPKDRLVIVGWHDEADHEGKTERCDFDYLDDGVWAKWEENVEWAGAVAPPGSRLPSQTPPYRWWIELPAVPAAPTPEAPR